MTNRRIGRSLHREWEEKVQRLKSQAELEDRWAECRSCYRAFYVGQMNRRIKRFGFSCPYCDTPIVELLDAPPPLY